MTRRSVLAVVVTSLALLQSDRVTAKQTERPSPVDLGHGLEIRDYRLFPTEDVMRFLVEIHNTTDVAVDTPTIGVVLPHIDEDGNYGWANPLSTVLHPQTSGCLIGVAPAEIATDEEWGTPEWMLCDSVVTQKANSMDHWYFELDFTITIHERTRAQAMVTVTNHGSEQIRRLWLQGLVLDAQARICGATVTGQIPGLAPGETVETGFTIRPEYTYHANPFTLIDTVESIDFSFSVQPEGTAVNPGCPPVMPW